MIHPLVLFEQKHDNRFHFFSETNKQKSGPHLFLVITPCNQEIFLKICFLHQLLNAISFIHLIFSDVKKKNFSSFSIHLSTGKPSDFEIFFLTD